MGKSTGSAPSDAPRAVRLLAQQLRRQLEKAGLTNLRAIASAAAVGKTTVGDALNCTKVPSWDVVKSLLKAARVPADAAWQDLHKAAKDADAARKSTRRSGNDLPEQPGSPSAPVEAGSLRAPYGELPRSVRGRDQLLAILREELTRPTGRVQVLEGLGGCGKTTVALQLAAEAHARHLDVYWISAATREGISTGMQWVARRLGVDEGLIQAAWSGQESATDLVWAALDAAPLPWLLVVDNADQPQWLCSGGAPGDGTGWVRPSPAGLALVTTRAGGPEPWGAEAQRHTVEALSPEHGGEVLMDLAPDAGSAVDAERLSERLGGLPLALWLAGSFLARTRRGADLLTRTGARDFPSYAEALDRLGPGLLDRSACAHREPISRTWELSLDLLQRQGLPAARGIMRLLSCFAHAPFPADLLDILCLAESGVLPATAVADDCDRALEALVDLGLVDVVDIGLAGPDAVSVPCVTMHPLVREVNAVHVRNGLDEHVAGTWRAAAHSVHQVTHWNPRDPRAWPWWELLLPHVLHGLAAVPAEAGDAVDHYMDAGHQAVSYSAQSGSKETIGVCLAMLFHRGDQLHADHPAKLAVRRLRIQYVRDVAVDEGRDLVTELRATSGPTNHKTLQTHLVWAHALLSHGLFDEAEREFESLVDTIDGCSPPDLPGGLYAHMGLVETLAQAGRDERVAAEAGPLLTRIRQAREHGELELNVRHHLAHALDAVALLSEAEAEYRYVLAELERVGAQDAVLHWNMSRALLKNLGRQRRYEDALHQVERMLGSEATCPETEAVPCGDCADLRRLRTTLRRRGTHA